MSRVYLQVILSLGLGLGLSACQTSSDLGKPGQALNQAAFNEKLNKGNGLVPTSNGGTLGNGLVPTSNGGTLGNGLVPTSNGGTLGKGLVPESKGGTLGRVILTGKVIPPPGFRTQQTISPWLIEVLEPQQKEVWVKFQTQADGSFELANVPVETLLKLQLKSPTAGQTIPLQAWIRIAASDTGKVIHQNLDTESTVQALLLGGLLPMQEGALPLPRAVIEHPRYQQAFVQIRELLEQVQIQSDTVQLITQAQATIKELFEQIKGTGPAPAETAAPATPVPTLPDPTTPAYSFSNSGGAGSNRFPFQVRVKTANGLPFDSDTLIFSDIFGIGPETLLAGAPSPSLVSFGAPSGNLSFETYRLGLPQARHSQSLAWQVPQTQIPELILPPLLTNIQALTWPTAGNLTAQWSAEGNPAEITGNYNGVLQNAVGFGPGIQGQAFGLNGFNTGILISNIDFARQNYSVACWFKTDWLQAQSLVQAVPGFALGLTSSGQLTYAHQPPASIQTISAVNDNAWHQAVAVREGQQELLYLDGVLAQSRNSTLTDINSLVDLHLGYGNLLSDLPFKGLLDEVSVYSQALPAASVQMLYQRRALNVTGKGFGQLPAENRFALAGANTEVFTASPTQLRVKAPDSLAGTLQAQLETGTVLSNTLALTAVPLKLDSVSRRLVNTGDQLVLSGAGFDASTTVSLAGIPASILQITPNAITVQVPPGVVKGPVLLANSVSNLKGPEICAVPAPPLSWWRGENDAIDSMGNHNGALMGGVQFTAGKTGQAFLLNSAGAHIDLGVIDAFQSDFTVTGWFRSAMPQNTTLLSGTQAGLAGLVINQVAATPGLSFLFQFPYGAAGGFQSAGGTLTSSHWHHFAVVKHNLYQSLYLDGILIEDLDNALNFDAPLQILLGRLAPGDGSADFKGALDEILLFNQALSTANIEQIYQFSR